MYDDYTIEQIVDELKSLRDFQKELKSKEEILKQRILLDGRSSIKGKNHKATISIRTKEVFNEDAFIQAFANDVNYDDALKGFIIESKPYVNKDNLTEAIKEEKIPLEYVIPFNEISQSKVITIK